MKRQILLRMVIFAVILCGLCCNQGCMEKAQPEIVSGKTYSETDKTEEELSEGSSEEPEGLPSSKRTFSYMNPSMAEKDSVVYYLDSISVPQHICYFDRESGKSGFLCGKPDCLHRDSDCNAWTGTPEFCLLIQSDDQYIWWAAHEKAGEPLYLFRMDYDGTNRRKVLKLAEYSDNLSFPKGTVYAEIVGGQLIAGGINFRVEDGRAEYRSHIDRYTISGSGTYETVFDSGYTETPPDMMFRCFGEAICYSILSGTDPGTDSSVEIVRCERAPDQDRIVFRGKIEKPSAPFHFSVTEEGIYYLITSEQGKTILYSLPPESQEPQECFTTEMQASAWLAGDRAVFYSASDKGIYHILATDCSGNCILEGDYQYSHEGTIPTMYRTGADEDYIYLRFEWGEFQESETAAIPLDGSDMKILWRQKWQE